MGILDLGCGHPCDVTVTLLGRGVCRVAAAPLYSMRTVLGQCSFVVARPYSVSFAIRHSHHVPGILTHLNAPIVIAGIATTATEVLQFVIYDHLPLSQCFALEIVSDEPAMHEEALNVVSFSKRGELTSGTLRLTARS
jgi:hypothetical protein